jgi:hypothetical protein
MVKIKDSEIEYIGWDEYYSVVLNIEKNGEEYEIEATYIIHRSRDGSVVDTSLEYEDKDIIKNFTKEELKEIEEFIRKELDGFEE